jgi:hypothetical protein
MLLLHFYAVAMYGLVLILLGLAPPPHRIPAQIARIPILGTILLLPYNLYRCLTTLWEASCLLLPAMFAEFTA